MNPTPFFHGTFTLRRAWKATPALIFSAWSDPKIKEQWFGCPSSEWKSLRRSIDFRVGGSEIAEGLFFKSGMKTLYEARYHLIEHERRLAYIYDLHLSDTFHSVTFSSLLLQPDKDITHVSYTEQIVFLDGRDGTALRKDGTEYQFSMIANVLLGAQEADDALFVRSPIVVYGPSRCCA